MSKIQVADASAPGSSYPYLHLQPIAAALVAAGNRYRVPEAWGSDREGFVCWLQEPIDFELVSRVFELPATVVLSRAVDVIFCEVSGARIQGGSYGQWMRPNNSSKPTPLRGAA